MNGESTRQDGPFPTVFHHLAAGAELETVLKASDADRAAICLYDQERDRVESRRVNAFSKAKLQGWVSGWPWFGRVGKGGQFVLSRRRAV